MFTTAQSGLSAIPLAALVCLTLFSGSTSGAFSRSGAQSASEVTMEQIGTTTFIEPSGDAPSPSKWTSPTFFSDLSAFKVARFSSGKNNLEVVAGVTPDAENTALADDPSTWTNASTMLQVFYPKGSINPARKPQGGSQFYAAPLDLQNARSVTLAYSVFFPSDFDWVKGGKLPGLYGGRTGCSGGDAADDCFSTRLMWRSRGAGELYLYAPKDRQTPSLCNTPPLSVCNQAYGLSIGRGSFRFELGSWTHLRQTVVLNTPGYQDGVFLLEVNGRVALDLSDVFYRDVQKSSTTPEDPDSGPAPVVPDPTAPPDVGDGLLGPLLGDLLGLVLEDDGTQVRASAAQQGSSDSNAGPRNVAAVSPARADRRADVVPHVAREDGEPIGFKGIFFCTFFGGHDQEWATPKDQFVWFKNFELSINDLE
ncbi:hypothetical protein EDB83DRAFT_2292791 [Lactarius deliciosus]|nr:hypothetical protein EDB83DRAFT_2292791 [Lactarius deliciosus]